MRSRTSILAFALLLSCAPAVHAKSYSADRFDARIRVLRGGGLEVTETIVFSFDGTFKEVFQQIPRRRTDGVDVVRVSMDGLSFTKGKGPGCYDLSNNKGLRVRWHFVPVTNSVHTFELTYVARGVVQQSDRGDLLAWRALPSEHDYPIASSTIGIDLPAPPIEPPMVNTQRTATSRIGAEDTHVTFSANGIRSNGWLEVSIVMAPGSAIDGPPSWQARNSHAAEVAPTWLIMGAIILVTGAVLLLGIRQGYESPTREPNTGPTGPDLPDTATPAVAGALVSNGRSGIEQAMATLFALADRGELTIVENPKRWGQRSFDLKRTPTQQPLADYERAVLDIAFTGRGPEDRTDLPHVRGRITRRLKRFSRAVERQMFADGLIDEGRLAVRNRYAWVGSGAVILATLALIPTAVVINDYGAWPLVIPGAIMAVGVIGLIMYAAHTPLSNEGIRRAREWRGFQRFLRQVTRDRATVPDGQAARLLPFAVAAGLAMGWASYLKKHEGSVPPWFRALASDQNAHLAFAYFVGSGGSGPATTGAGAAGGGASGAH